MRVCNLLICILASLAVITGCGDDKKSDGGAGDTDTDTDTDSDSDTDTDSDSDTDPAGDDCANAIPIELNAEEGYDGWINENGPIDFYSLEVTEGDFIIVFTSANPEDDTEKVDTVVSIYSADGSTLLATGDDSVPRFTTDSELFYRAAETGTLCLKVEEWTTWMNDPDNYPFETDPAWKYTLYARTMDQVNGSNPETEPNDDLSEAQTVEFYSPTNTDNTYAFFYGTFDPSSDVDVYSYTLPANNTSAHLYFQPIGPGGAGENAAEGHGSTADLGLIELTDNSGNVIAALDASLGAPDMSVPLPEAAEVAVWIRRPDGSAVGANDFYVIRYQNWDAASENPAEAEVNDNSNDTLATAETIPISQGHGYILGYIDPAGDVDYFAFEAGSYDTLTMACGAARSGSGLEGATFAVHDSDDTMLQSETEVDTVDVWWSDSEDASEAAVALTPGETYYLKVSATGQDPNVSSKFYRCGLHPVSE